MADVKWIKITTDIFDDDKILLIESLPEADSIIVIWFKLLCLSGRQNNGGVFMMNNKIAYTDKMLATIFRRKEATIQLALKTFEQFGMIELIDGVITIPNWEKHQNLDTLEKIREQTRKRVSKHREKQKQIASNVTVTQEVTQCNATEKKREEKKEKRIEGEEEKSVIRNTYGEYDNVLLSDEEYSKLTQLFPCDYLERIERLSSYMASSGKTYDNHLATITFWAEQDKKKQSAPSQQGCSNPFLQMMKQKE
jgi:predicted phage replisome organizer